MGYVPGDPVYNDITAIYCFVVAFLLFTMLVWFLSRRDLQPISFRGPWFLSCVIIAIITRVSTAGFLSIYPTSSPCGIVVFYIFGFYVGLAVGLVRLYLLLFAYKLQGERVAMQEGKPRGWWMAHVQWARKRRAYPMAFFLTVFLVFFNMINLHEVSCSEVIDLKRQLKFSTNNNESFLNIQEPENQNYCAFSDRCPDSSIDPFYYLIVMAVYLILVTVLACNLRTFDQDRFYVNFEMRLTAIWLLYFIVIDLILGTGIDSTLNYLTNAQMFQEATAVLMYGFIALLFPIYKSYVLARKAHPPTGNFAISVGKLNETNDSSARAAKSQSQVMMSEEHETEAGDEVGIFAGQPSTPVNLVEVPVRKSRFTIVGSKRKEQNDFLGVKKLRRIFKEPKGVELFKKHLLLEFSVENILCHEAVNKLFALMDDKQVSIQDILAASKRFVMNFVSVSGDNQVNVSASQRNALEKALEQALAAEVLQTADPCEENMSRLKSCMTQVRNHIGIVQDEIFLLMAKDSYPRFANTKEFQSYLRNEKKLAKDLAKLDKSGNNKT